MLFFQIVTICPLSLPSISISTGYSTIENLVSLVSTQEHNIQLCVKILQIVIGSGLWKMAFSDSSYFYVPLCGKKVNVQCSNDDSWGNKKS